jgi:predicted SAM-dependent methyltransferase
MHLVKLNLGCGDRYLTEWTNIDFIATSRYVQQHNLTKGIPMADNTCEVVYHSHVLEHFRKQDAVYFLKECFRVLQKGGVVRIAVPDLEMIVKCYLENLNKVVESPTPLNQANYNWSVIELIDQMTRNESGGEMKKFWESKELLNESYLTSRLGFEFTEYRKRYLNSQDVVDTRVTGKSSNHGGLISRLKNRIIQGVLRPYQKQIDIGAFRTSGEIHQWMYDRHSLSVLLKEIGFNEIQQKDAFNSNIAGWDSYQYLDVENGKPRKPDSLYIEGFK